ncbi:hypothetical protein NDU88_003826 [Pleurodeles waltl]|uniref:Uncharacterized protein n=1 Tax=Pleurodeles waltl TaxID=8319 RepID=A0AAV7KW33_PLEWA|nr:hypothetical protein NDU88_003826 [Pleurodeles waltl]
MVKQTEATYCREADSFVGREDHRIPNGCTNTAMATVKSDTMWRKRGRTECLEADPEKAGTCTHQHPHTVASLLTPRTRVDLHIGGLFARSRKSGRFDHRRNVPERWNVQHECKEGNPRLWRPASAQGSPELGVSAPQN